MLNFQRVRAGDLCYYVFHNRKVVRLVTNAFPEHMDSPVARLHPEGVLRKQNVPPILLAYNKYMCAVDRTKQLGKNYDRFWLRLMNRLFNIAVNNAYTLYRHSCKRQRVTPKDALAFRLELVRCLLDKVGLRRGVTVSSVGVDMASSEKVCYLERVSDIPGMKRGRCRQCVLSKTKKPRHTSFGCGVCRVRLCKTHNY